MADMCASEKEMNRDSFLEEIARLHQPLSKEHDEVMRKYERMKQMWNSTILLSLILRKDIHSAARDST